MSQSGSFNTGGSGGSGIQTINTIGPAVGGDFTIESTDGSVIITPETNGIDLSVTGAFEPVAFSAYLTTTISGATGDGTQVTPAYDGVLSNVGSAYNPATGVFTAPATGVYLFTYISCYNNASAATAFINAFASGSPENFNFRADQATAANVTSGSMIQNGSIIVPLTSGTTMQMLLAAYGTTRTVSIEGGVLTLYAATSMFTGCRIA